MAYDDEGGFNRSPLLSPMLKAYQLFNLIQNTRDAQTDREYEKVRRERERIAFENSQADRTRAISLDDFMRDYGMRKEGAIPVAPDAATAAPKITGGPFSGIQMPGGFFKDSIIKNEASGKAYRVPTEQEGEEKAISKAARLKSIEHEINEPRKVQIEIPEKLRPRFRGQTHLLVDEDKETSTVDFLQKMERGNIGIYHTAGGLGAYDEDVIREKLRNSKTGVVEVPTPGIASQTRSGNYTEKEKRAANLRALGEWKKRYPNGKTTEDFDRAVKAYAADNSVSEDEARKQLSSSKRARDRYGVSDIYVKSPKEDLEFQELENGFLESGGSPAPQGAGGASGKSAAAPKIAPQMATQQVSRYAAMRNSLTPAQQAQAEEALVTDLIAGGVVRNEKDARAYIQRQLSGLGGGNTGKREPETMVPREQVQSLIDELRTNQHVKQ